MNKFFRVSFLAFALCSVVMLSSCNEDPPLPENKVSFQSNTQGLGAAETEITVTLTLVREAETDGTITLNYTSTDVTYGPDFITDPVSDGNKKIVVPVAAGALTASFKITKTNTTGLEGNEKVLFTIESVTEGLVIGEQLSFTLSFSEIIATSASMEVSGGGATYPNIVYIDLSGNRQTAVARTAWDLAFSSKGDEFRVILNSPNGMLARALDKTDLSTVTAADTVGFGGKLSIGAIFGVVASTEVANFPDWIATSTSWIDNPAGDITKTAIAEVSATEASNKVYIVNRGTGPNNASLGWKKIRVIRNGSNYTLQYADIASPNFSTVNIAKNAATRFNYVSLTSGTVVTVEPELKKWDIAWTGFTNTTPTGAPPAPSIPYYFQDMIVTNIGGTAQTFTYTTGTTGAKTYDTFTDADLTGITYSTSQIGIGSSWRTTGGPPPSPPAGVNTSRFYIVKDADGNIYKVQFTALVTNGERGKPQFKFALLKKAA